MANVAYNNQHNSYTIGIFMNGPSQMSAFQPILLKSTLLSELEAFTLQLIANKDKILLEENTEHTGISHPLTQMMLDMITSLNAALGKPDRLYSFVNFNTISYTLLKNLGIMAENELFQIKSAFYRELCKTILFEKQFTEVIKRFFSLHRSNPEQFNLLEFDSIISSICKTDFKQAYEQNLYTMLGGTFVAMQAKIFQQSLYYIIWNLGKFFTSKNNFITRNINHLKKNKSVHDILGFSVKFICNYQNKEFIEAEIKKVSNVLFSSEAILKHQFLQKVRKIEKNDQISHILWVFLDMLQAESIIISNEKVKEQINSQKQVDSSNFYEQEMQKLFKKCPYNGDDCCSCKKCQCVRRNRESAKLSQQKKRNAVQQLDPLKKRIEELERKNKELQQQNTILKGIFNQMKNSPALKEALSSTLDPISKVLND